LNFLNSGNFLIKIYVSNLFLINKNNLNAIITAKVLTLDESIIYVRIKTQFIISYTVYDIFRKLYLYKIYNHKMYE